MNIEELKQQYRGTTLPKLVEKQINSLKENVLQNAIQGTYENFPREHRQKIDEFTLAYAQNWFNPSIRESDLSDVFTQAIKDIEVMAKQEGMSLNQDQTFDVFNIIVMRVSFFAHSKPEFRKMLGIKKGWFS